MLDKRLPRSAHATHATAPDPGRSRHRAPLRRRPQLPLREIPVDTPGQLRYNTPATGSANLEDITFYLRFLLALPTLRLTLDHQAADFLATPLLDQLRKEPLCRAARL